MDGLKVRKSNKITPRDIGFLNLSVILQKTLSAGVMSSRKQQPEILPELLFTCLLLHSMWAVSQHCIQKPLSQSRCCSAVDRMEERIEGKIFSLSMLSQSVSFLFFLTVMHTNTLLMTMVSFRVEMVSYSSL